MKATWTGLVTVVAIAVTLCGTASVSAEGIDAYSNNPSQLISTPNNPQSKARKEAILKRYEQAQQDYISGKLTAQQYQDLRHSLKGDPSPSTQGRISIQPATVGYSDVLMISAEQQQCKEYCGPASTHEALVWSGNSSLSETQIASLEGTGACTPINSSSRSPVKKSLEPK